MNIGKIKSFCANNTTCKLKQAFSAKIQDGINNKGLSTDKFQPATKDIRDELLEVRSKYLETNQEAFITLDHIKSNFDNDWLIGSIKGQTDDLQGVSTDDFCNLSEIMKGIRLPEDVHVYRAMGTRDFNIGQLEPEEFFQKYYREGKQITIPVYMSTSFDKKIAYTYQKNNPNRFILKLDIPKGHPAVYMEKLTPGDGSVYGNEDEINVIRNSVIELGKLTKKTNPLTNKPIYEVEAKVVGFKDVPVEPKKTEMTMDDDMLDLMQALKSLKN